MLKIKNCKKIKKCCSKCNKLLFINLFPKRKDSYDGRRNICKKCYYESKKNIEKICIYCGIKFFANNKSVKYCSKECSNKDRIKYFNGDRKKYNHVCEKCGLDFKSVNSKQKYCSYKCSIESRIKIYNRKCVMCHKDYKPRTNNSKYCSRECRAKADLKERLIFNCSFCGNEVKILKSQISNKKRIFCSKKCVHNGNSIFYRGENSPSWNPNITQEEREKMRHYDEYNDWRKKIFARDNYTCQCCGDNNGGNLRAHHYLNYSEHPSLRTDINNGITLCKECHKEFHDTYGYKNNNIQQFKEFLQLKKT